MRINDKLKNISKPWYFFIIIIIVYSILFFFNNGLFILSFHFFCNILSEIIPVFLFILILMTLSDYYIKPKFILKHLTDKGVKKWFFIVIGGVLSSGPIYMWYPLLADFKKKGLSNGLIACFLYNRAIKIPLIPIAISYFSYKYILILCFTMIFASIMQGLIINKLFNVKK